MSRSSYFLINKSKTEKYVLVKKGWGRVAFVWTRLQIYLGRFVLMSSLLSGSLSGCNSVNGIPVIGLDERTDPTRFFVPIDQYTSGFVALVSSVQDSTIPVLEGRDQQLGWDLRWTLRAITFGVGIQSEIGIGPFKVGASPRIRLLFTNSSKVVAL